MANVPVLSPATQQFQAQLDALSDGDELQLHAFEYPGPIVLRKKITLDGSGATLWALRGPVCTIDSPGVTLKNTRIEATGEDIENGETLSGCALQVLGGHNVLLENVQVRGSVRGLPAEEGQWRYPLSLNLGDLEYGHEHRLVLRLYVPVPCSIKPEVHGISVSPHSLTPGRHEVVLTVETPARDAVLLGSICLQTAFLKRQISVSGHVVQSGHGPSTAICDGRVLYEPSDWGQLGSVPAPREEAIEVQPATPPQPPPPPVKPPPEPGRPAERTQVSRAETPSAGAGGRATRIVHRDVQLSGIFGQAPPPVKTDAGPMEPGAKLSPVFGPPSPGAEPQSVSSAPGPESGPSEKGSPAAAPVDENKGRLDRPPRKKSPSNQAPLRAPPSIPTGNAFAGNAPSAESGPERADKSGSEPKPPPAGPPAHQANPPRKMPLRTQQSLPIGNAFAENAEPDQQEKKETKDPNGPSGDPQAEKTQPRSKPKRPMRDGNVPNIFFP